MVRRGHLRASDFDREQVAERLRQAAADGRLLAEELEARLASALRARTYGELDPLVADLPGGRLTTPAPRTLSPLRAVTRAIIIALVVVGVLAVVAMVITGVIFVWAMWMFVAWWMFSRGRHMGRRCHGRPAHVRAVHRRSLL